jgi:hypothetical protein
MREQPSQLEQFSIVLSVEEFQRGDEGKAGYRTY